MRKGILAYPICFIISFGPVEVWSTIKIIEDNQPSTDEQSR